MPGRMQEVFATLSFAGKAATRRGARAAAALLGESHPEAREGLLRIAGR